MTYDLVVKDARIVDGTGKPEYRGDVAIESGVIAALGEVSAGRARSTQLGRSSLPASSTHTRTTTRSCCGIRPRTRRPRTASRPFSPAIAATRSRLCGPTIRTT